MKNVLVLIHDDPGQESRLQAGLDITRTLAGHLICSHVTVPPDVPPDVAIAAGGGTLMIKTVEQEKINRGRVEKRLLGEGVPWSWVATSGDLGGAMYHACKLADIIVLNRALDTSTISNMARVAGDVIVGSHKPVVAVPEGVHRFVASGTALIAWDGSVPASQAVTECVPLLKHAEKVIIVEVDGDPLGAPAEEVAVYLSCHGISAHIVHESRSRKSASEAIIATASACGAAYILMGGFGRSRLYESLFGGVSHDLLEASPIPLVLVHGR